MIKYKTDKYGRPKEKVNDIKDKMTVVVGPDTIVYPRTMMIVFGDTTAAAFAMFTPKWPSNHACDAKVLVVEFP